MRKLLLLIVPLLFLTFSPAHTATVPLMTIDELNEHLGDSVIVLDVRSESDWNDSKYKIKGAVRASGKDFGNWSEQYPKDARLVLYCA